MNIKIFPVFARWLIQQMSLRGDKNEISIEEKGWSLTPGAYVDVAPVEDDGVDFEEYMAEIHRELLSLQAESNELMDTISKNMREMGL